MSEIIRVEKNKNYTCMSNYHFKDRRLSYKAKGLLSLALSLPPDWDYTIKGLATLSADGVDSVRNGIKELEKFGYVVINRIRDERGVFRSAEYIFYEKPILAEPILENSILDKPTQDNPTQLNTKILNKKELNIYSSSEPVHNYADIEIQIKQNIEYDYWIRRGMKEKIESYIKIIVKGIIDSKIAEHDRQELLKLNSQHIQMVIDRFSENATEIKNINAYLLKCFINAPSEIDAYYENQVRHDFADAEYP